MNILLININIITFFVFNYDETLELQFCIFGCGLQTAKWLIK